MAGDDSVMFYYYPGGSGQSCDRCNERFMDHRSWLRHVEMRHGNCRRVYLCERCGRQAPSILSASTHHVHCLRKMPVRSPMRMRVEPTELVVGTPLQIINEDTLVVETRLLCPECGRSFDSKAGVSLHRKARHPMEYNWDVLALVSSRNVLWTDGELHVMASEELNMVAVKSSTVWY